MSIFSRQPPGLKKLTIAHARRVHENGDEAKLHGSQHSNHVGDFVFGAIDGTVTTFAIVAGVAGAQLSAHIVVVLGIANLLADGFAMAVGNFLSIRSEQERYAREYAREKWEVENIPDLEKKEIEDIYRNKGFTGEALKLAVDTITANNERWVETMMREELGLAQEIRSPWRGSIITYTAFIGIGFIPLISYLAALILPSLSPFTFEISIGLTGLALFFIGAIKTIVVQRPLMRSGLETFLMGGLAAILAYAVGYMLRGIT
jgi:vacuolar iron transporter family protein